MAHLSNTEFQPLNIAVLTVSDTRNLDTDTSGQALIDGERIAAAGFEAREPQLFACGVVVLYVATAV